MEELGEDVNECRGGGGETREDWHVATGDSEALRAKEGALSLYELSKLYILFSTKAQRYQSASRSYLES